MLMGIGNTSGNTSTAPAVAGMAVARSMTTARRTTMADRWWDDIEEKSTWRMIKLPGSRPRQKVYYLDQSMKAAGGKAHADMEQ
jgi:hypothetical protein